MPDLVFQAYAGLHVTLSYDQFTTHIHSRHNDVSVDDIREALTQPTRICNHVQHPNRRIYEGPAKLRGMASFKTMVSVRLTAPQAGEVITAFHTGHAYMGVQRWP